MAAAKDAAGSQHYPPGTLYVVATPIGNLADITLRALHVLALVDVVACEDTRHTQTLLRGYGVEAPRGGLIALHQHNEHEATQRVLSALQAGQRVAYVSDAGTPAVSDPGARLVAAAHAAGLRVVPLPGASSVTTLLSAAGAVGAGGSGEGGFGGAGAGSGVLSGAGSAAAWDEAAGSEAPGQAEGAQHRSGFRFIGFLPSKSQARDQALRALAAEPQAVLLLEAPHRIAALASALAALGTRRVTVGRELTKQFEEIATVSAAELPGWLAADANRLRGEFALLLHPAPTVADGGEASSAALDKVLGLLLPELPLKTAVRIAAEWTGAARNTVYARALQIKAGQENAKTTKLIAN